MNSNFKLSVMTCLISFTTFICFSSILSSSALRVSVSSSGVALSSARSRMTSRSVFTMVPGFKTMSSVKSFFPIIFCSRSSSSRTIGSSPETSSKKGSASGSASGSPAPPSFSSAAVPCMRVRSRRAAPTACRPPPAATAACPRNGATTGRLSGLTRPGASRFDGAVAKEVADQGGPAVAGAQWQHMARVPHRAREIVIQRRRGLRRAAACEDAAARDDMAERPATGSTEATLPA
mmetsp:Transcript_129637/g.276518  ORF Transcript_129637/g.276518 Transcript_129637/m.276518 type:complete len:235 (+) Transcript_129637:649-1353(+)